MRTLLLSSLLAVGLATFTLASPAQGPQAPAPAPGASAPAAATECPKTGGRGDAPLPEARPVVWQTGKKKVLLVGGGSSHNFTEFFDRADSATLAAAGFGVNYTEDRDRVVKELAGAVVAVLSVNRRCFDSADYRRVLFEYANAGKGIVLVHAGAWYMYPQWPEVHA